MQLLWPDEPGRCVPLKITAPSSEASGSLGGPPPRGVMPATAGLRYFATVPVATSPELRLSLFVADFKRLLACRGRITPPGLLDVQVHEPRPREASSPVASPLNPCGLLALEPREDREVDEEGRSSRFLGHKLGGAPCLIRETATLLRELEALSGEGYTHVLQFVFPAPDEPVEGTWPFGDGVLHVFGRLNTPALDWRWLWDR